jgi:hypothetical protein
MTIPPTILKGGVVARIIKREKGVKEIDGRRDMPLFLVRKINELAKMMNDNLRRVTIH